MKKALLSTIIGFLLLIFFGEAFCEEMKTKSSPNYLVILIHGIGSKGNCFGHGDLDNHSWERDSGDREPCGDLKYYLEKDLGLEGYVYNYSFSNNLQSNNISARELGDRTYYKNNPSAPKYKDARAESTIDTKNCMLDQAKEDFKQWYARQYYRGDVSNVSKSVIPQKFILICHSMGGLAARRYINSSFYERDVIKTIFVDTPQTGADGIIWYEKFKVDYGVMRGLNSTIMDYILQIMVENISKSFGSPPMESIYVTASMMALGGMANLSTDILFGLGEAIANPSNISLPNSGRGVGTIIKDAMSTKTTTFNADLVKQLGGSEIAMIALFSKWEGDGFSEINPDSQFVKEMKSARPVEDLEYRLISARGAPTPDKNLSKSFYGLGAYPTGLMLPFLQQYKSLPSEGAKLYSAMLSVDIPGIFAVKDGSILVAVDSSKGEGVEAFKTNTKKYDYLFVPKTMDTLAYNAKSSADAIFFSYMAMQMIPGFQFNPYILSTLLYSTAYLLSRGATVACASPEMYEFFALHGYILNKIYDDKEASNQIIDLALDETPFLGGKTNTEEVKREISSSSVDTPTASYNNYDQMFVLLSNKSVSGSVETTYHSVTIETISETKQSPQAIPIVFNGTKKWISGVMVKEAPTAIKGVINTFLPKKLKYFEYSENFGEWKRVSEVDEWGNFTVRNLNLAEGQNVLAFRAESWTGNKMSQHLTITLNTIPLLAYGFSPTPESYTNNSRPEFKVVFGKASYSTAEGEEVNIISAEVSSITSGFFEDITKKISVKKEGGEYDKRTTVSYLPSTPLNDGRYDIVVKAKSNVGVSQAMWAVNIDTRAPSLEISPIAPSSKKSEIIVEYSASDESSSGLMSKVFCTVNKKSGEELLKAGSQEMISSGLHQFYISPETLPDGEYDVKIKVFDMAGNSSSSKINLVMDSTPPRILGMEISPKIASSLSSEAKFTISSGEKAQCALSLYEKNTKQIKNYIFPVENQKEGKFEGAYLFSFSDLFGDTLPDGDYRIQSYLFDEAGNIGDLSTIESFVVDRTPPVIYSQSTLPYAMSNSGQNPYKTTLSYRISVKNSSKTIKTKIKLYSSETGELLRVWEEAPSALGEENKILWDAGSLDYKKGSYKFQIISQDNFGNTGEAFAYCVKDGISPQISFPLEELELSSLFAVKGTAVDPDWTNGSGFKEYNIFYKKGKWGKPSSIDSSWTNYGVALLNEGKIPQQNETTLGYINPQNLEEGDYTILLFVSEQNGEKMFDVKHVFIKKETDSLLVETPKILLEEISREADFKESPQLKVPISASLLAKPANVYIDIVKDSGETILSRYFPRVFASAFSGRPSYVPGKDLGYYIWKDSSGWHLRFSADSESRRFSGQIVFMDAKKSAQYLNSSGFNDQETLISWDKTFSGKEDGLDFNVLQSGDKTPKIMVIAKIDDDPKNPSLYATNIFFGGAKKTTQYLPIMIDAKTEELVDFTGSSLGVESEYLNSAGFLWDGKLDSGGYAGSGTYIVKARAESLLGEGISFDEKQIKIYTPFEIKNVSAVNKEFNPLSFPDRCTIYYNVSKDSVVSAYAYKEDSSLVATIFENKKVSGGESFSQRDSFSWVGEPGKNGKYFIKITAKAEGENEEKSAEIRGITVLNGASGGGSLSLNPVGNEIILNNEKVLYAEGESPYKFEALGEGLYYEPKDFSGILSAEGTQKLTLYPYLPFAALLHRGFKNVDVKFKVYLKVFGFYDKKEYGVRARSLLEVDFSWWEKRDVSFDIVLEGEKSFSKTDQVFEKTYTFTADDACPKDLAGNTKSGAVLSSKITKIEVWTKRGEPPYVLDSAVVDFAESDSFSMFGKGMFAVQNAGVRILPDNKDYKCVVKLKLPDESPIEYSRLTNRFVPWVDFVSAKAEVKKDDNFSGYLDKLDKLGFPGEEYFNGKKSAQEKAPHKGVYSPIKSVSVKNIKDLDELSKTGFDSSYASDYTAYLSNEFSEFIPIIPPDKGFFEFADGTKAYDSTIHFQEKKDFSALGIKAKTSLSLPDSAFVFAWPFPDIEGFKSKYGVGGELHKKLSKAFGGDPSLYDGYGGVNNKCFYDLDIDESEKRSTDLFEKKVFGTLVLNNAKTKSEWISDDLPKILPIPSYVGSVKYFFSGFDEGIKADLLSLPGRIYIQDLSSPQRWSTKDDTLLASGLIESENRLFNEDDFSPLRRINIFSDSSYKTSNDYETGSALKNTYLKKDKFLRTKDSPLFNPNIVLQNWKISVKSFDGETNKDLLAQKAEAKGTLNDCFDLKLSPKSQEKRFVEIKGSVSGPYELLYFDGGNIESIGSYNATTSETLAFWNVSRLAGKYTLILKSNGDVASKDIYIGTPVKKSEEKKVFSSYRRAELSFPPNAFEKDEMVEITPVSVSEIKIKNRPVLLSHGPIVEIKPSPRKFKNPKDGGIDTRPTLKFYYTLEDLLEMGIYPDPANPLANLGLNIHQITQDGSLEVIDKSEQTYDSAKKTYCFSGPLDHFSTYTLLKGKITLLSPVVFAEKEITNQKTASFYGTAEENSVLDVYFSFDKRTSLEGLAKIYEGKVVGGKINVKNLELQKEGKNYFYFVTYAKDYPEYKTVSEVCVEKDTIPPKLEARQNVGVFSPNGDGAFDSVDFYLKASEKGALFVDLRDTKGGNVFSCGISLESGREYRIGVKDQKISVFLNDEELLSQPVPKLFDGKYSVLFYSIDMAGNISNNEEKTFYIDTKAPEALDKNISPKKIEPAGKSLGGAKAKIYIKTSEPVSGRLEIKDSFGKVFSSYSLYSKNFSQTGTLNIGSKDFVEFYWDGKGERGEIIKGEYSVFFVFYDNAKNIGSVEVGNVVVDFNTSLIAYSFADPDPFSPTSKGNNYSDIKFYLSRPDLALSAFISGNDGRVLKTLAENVVSPSGEGYVRWYGDSDFGELPDGAYQYVLRAVDLSENLSFESYGTVLVDNIPPVITIVSLEVDAKNMEAKIRYLLPEKSSVEAFLVSENGNSKKLLDGEYLLAGEHSLSYKEESSSPYKKYFKIVAQDRAKNISEEKTALFALSMDAVPSIDLKIVPEIFSPNSDGIKDNIKIEYFVSGGEPPYHVNIKILSPGMATVKDIIVAEEQTPGKYSFYWDGRTDLSYVADGIYKAQVSLTDKNGNKTEKVLDFTAISSKPEAKITILSSTSSEVVFGYDVSYNNFYLSSEAETHIEIKNISEEAFFSGIFKHGPGNYTYSWNRKKTSGEPISYGNYYAKIFVVDNLGTYSLPAVKEFVLSDSFALPIDATPEASPTGEAPADKTPTPEAENPIDLPDDISTKESDTLPPEVDVDARLITLPSAFSTNADPMETDLPRGAVFYFTPSEEISGEVNVYKVEDGKTSYTKDDFSDSNFVFAAAPQKIYRKGERAGIFWRGEISRNKNLYDLNNDGYADPGKYAFAVYAKDMAGNSSVKLSGGTVWIQNNLLEIIQPQNLLVGSNPFPKNISPNGNSSANKSASFYFYVKKSLIPSEVKAPEKISAMGIEESLPFVGKYFVKVISGEAVVRTLASDEACFSGKDIEAVWDGKDDFGDFVLDGRYIIKAELFDFAGNKSFNRPFTAEVFVDNEAPKISSLIVSPEALSPGIGTNSLSKTLFVSLEAFDNSLKSNLKVELFKEDGVVPVETIISFESKENGFVFSEFLPGNIGTFYGGGHLDGKYFVLASSFDDAGNYSDVVSKEIIIDTLSPSFEASLSGRGWRKENIEVSFESFSGCSGTYKNLYAWTTLEGGVPDSWISYEGKAFITKTEEGVWYLLLQSEDNAHNSASSVFGPYKKDSTPPQITSSLASRNWGTGNISVALSASDSLTDIKEKKYAWTSSQSVPASGWADFSNAQPIIQSSDGVYYLHAKAEDEVGNLSSVFFGPYKKDSTPPVISVNVSSRDWMSSNISIVPTVSDSGSGIKTLQYKWTNSTQTPTSGWTNFSSGQSLSQGSDGTWYLHIRAEDNIGNIKNSYFGAYKKDSAIPTITNPVSASFNPYLASITLNFSFSDALSGINAVEARIEKTDGTVVKTLSLSGSGASRSTTWNGQNNSGDYVNEGAYKFKIIVKDNAQNQASNTNCTITLADDQLVAEGIAPKISIGNNLLFLEWVNGYSDSNEECTTTTSSVWNGSVTSNNWFYINFNGSSVAVTGEKGGNGSEDHRLYSASSNGDANGSILGGVNTYTLNKGWYRVYAYAQSSVSDGNTWASTKANYKYRWYKIYTKGCSGDFAKTIATTQTSGPQENDSYENGLQTAYYNNEANKVSVVNGAIYYQRGNGSTVKITSSGQNTSPCITVDNSGNCYVAWVNGSQIYFQKVPSNFAPVAGTVTASAIKNTSKPSSEALSLKSVKPVLIEPKEGDLEKTLRPLFVWSGIFGEKEYKLLMSKNPSIPDNSLSRIFLKELTQAESEKNYEHISFAIHEFDEGLSKGIWYWKVISNPGGTTEAVSDISNFEIDPPPSISGVTNYPNPFNPKKERTKIRYRLGCDADDVKIRIYDITGALVAELDGKTFGEGGSIWDKYNDVEWDGRNERGDFVANGIYPFEIVATTNGSSISGRGKIAVLK